MSTLAGPPPLETPKTTKGYFRLDEALLPAGMDLG